MVTDIAFPHTAETGSRPRVPRVLLLDDEISITTPVGSYLRGLGWELEVASEPEEALALVTHHRYDLAIVDLRLTRWGGGEGLAVLEEVRRLSPTTRLVVLSAYIDEAAEAEAWRRGADAVLRKPQPLPSLASVGLQLLGDSRD